MTNRNWKSPDKSKSVVGQGSRNRRSFFECLEDRCLLSASAPFDAAEAIKALGLSEAEFEKIGSDLALASAGFLPRAEAPEEMLGNSHLWQVQGDRIAIQGGPLNGSVESDATRFFAVLHSPCGVHVCHSLPHQTHLHG